MGLKKNIVDNILGEGLRPPPPLWIRRCCIGFSNIFFRFRLTQNVEGSSTFNTIYHLKTVHTVLWVPDINRNIKVKMSQVSIPAAKIPEVKMSE